MPMPLALLLLLLAPIAGCAPSASRVTSERAVTSERGTCIEGPHEPLRVRRLPGVAVMSARPQNPSMDQFVHCEEETKPESINAQARLAGSLRR